MNASQSRRQFLTEVGKGTLLATIGPTLAAEFGINPALASDAPPALHFGEIEPLVAFMQETPLGQLQPAMAAKLKAGVPLKRLLAAGVLANARSFGGEDYIGFHTLMALSPALKMSASMPEPERALPVFKVLYRNTQRIQDHGGRATEVLRPVTVTPLKDPATQAQLHEAVRRKDTAGAESLFATLMQQNPEIGFDALLQCVQDDIEVHRTVLPYRSWDLIDVVGGEHATTLLRQSLHYCLATEVSRRPEWDEHSRVLARLLEEHKLLGRDPGTRAMDDSVMERLSQVIFQGSPQEAAGAVAGALGEGFDPREIGEAISLAANQLVLRDHGRLPEWEATGKPAGSVHGDSTGVHASDSVHAWRNLSMIGHGHSRHACLILGAWQVANDRARSGLKFLEWEPLPSQRLVTLVQPSDAVGLLAELDGAIRANLQARATAIAEKYGRQGHAPEPLFQALLRYAVSEDGALHAEKYYQTCWDEFHRTRSTFRWRHLSSLARITASEFGRPAPGQAQARELLGV